MKNKYKIVDDYVVIYLERRSGEIFETYIDIEDFEKVNNFKYKWSADYKPDVDDYYAVATEYLGLFNGKAKYRSVYLHRFIFDNPENKLIDHENHNTLDNRKENLRIVEGKQNTKNRSRVNSNNKTGYRNVCYIESENKYIVQLQINGKNTRLGEFTDVHEAGKFAEEMRSKYYGEFKGIG